MKLRLGAVATTLAVAAITLPGTTLGSAPPATAADPSPSSPLVLRGPAKVVAHAYDGHVYANLGVSLAAPAAAFEVRSVRPSWDSPISTTWQSPGGAVTLPASAQTTWGGLNKLIKVSVTKPGSSKVIAKRRFDVCLNSWQTQRLTPTAPLSSPYPEGCAYHPYTKGSVQGIQAGWVTTVDTSTRQLRLNPGKYTITAALRSDVARTLGIAPADATRTYKLVVKKGSEYDGEEGAYRQGRGAGDRLAAPATEPSTARAGAPGDALPDLRALPAFGMEISGNGKHLRFSATVWNGGNGPLVVDGFRRGDSDVMDAYQYFVDTAGEQTGYQQVGTMIWHKARTHHHWHFQDFARYTLLRADKTAAVRSRKESFCLANTDAIDYTVPGANWKPENTDLHTACGDHSTISLREVLASGSGDTYDQFRAGQAFRIDKVPNGIYYVAVEGNPTRNLIESDTTNNVALRKIRMSGTATNRRLKVFPVGIIDDTTWGYGEY